MDSQCVGKEREYLYHSSSSISPYQRLRRFMHIWTIKEAYVKALGTGIYTDPQRLECRGLREDFLLPCPKREVNEEAEGEILKIDISMAPATLPHEREEHSEKTFCCTYTPSVSEEKQEEPSSSSSSSSITSCSDPEETKLNERFTLDASPPKTDRASLRLHNPLKILLDGVEQEEFHFECFSITPPRSSSSSSSQRKEKEDQEEREEEEEYLLTVCWAPVSSAHEKYRNCCMQFSPPTSPSLLRHHTDSSPPHKEGDERDLGSERGNSHANTPPVVSVHLNMSWITHTTLLHKHKKVASSSSARPSSSSSSSSSSHPSSSSSFS